MIERMRNGNGHWYDRSNGPVWAYRLAGKVASKKEEVTIVAVLKPPLFCRIDLCLRKTI